MNAERLHAISSVLLNEMEERQIIQRMTNLTNSLQNVVNNPQPGHQQTLANSVKEIYAALSETPSDSFSPTWRQILEELDGDHLFGQPLRDGIADIFGRNQITPAVAHSELQDLLKELNSFKKAIQQIISSFEYLNIGSEQLNPGECEIGMLIPRKEVHDSLIEFSEDLKDIGLILNTFSEVTTGKVDKLGIKTISSSDLLVYLEAIPTFAAGVAFAIERLVSIYKQFLEIRKLRSEMLKKGVPPKATADIEDHINKIMTQGILDLSKTIVEKFYKNDDEGRKNELKTQTRHALSLLATRIDRGYNFEVRVEPLKEDEQKDDAVQDTSENIKIIQDAAQNMQFLKLEGEPLLQLTDGKLKPSGKDKPEDRPKAEREKK